MYPLGMAGLLLGIGTLGVQVRHKLVFQIGISACGVASLNEKVIGSLTA